MKVEGGTVKTVLMKKVDFMKKSGGGALVACKSRW